MLQGSKAQQRKWWLYNRFRFMDSKYGAGDALTDVITIRAYNKGDITVTPYADIYVSIKYGSYLRMEADLKSKACAAERAKRAQEKHGKKSVRRLKRKQVG